MSQELQDGKGPGVHIAADGSRDTVLDEAVKPTAHGQPATASRSIEQGRLAGVLVACPAGRPLF
ncbi:hypothetical protein ACPA9J_08045 [Pseudomonas aeruginosa]